MEERERVEGGGCGAGDILLLAGCDDGLALVRGEKKSSGRTKDVC